MEFLSKFTGHSLIPAIHPTDEDVQMGAVDFLSEHPLENSTLLSNISTIQPTSAPLNATVGQRILDAVRVVVPTVVDSVAPSVTRSPLFKLGTVPPVVGHEVDSALPVDVHVDLYPQVMTKVYNIKILKNSTVLIPVFVIFNPNCIR
jgi:hypothetical protein